MLYPNSPKLILFYDCYIVEPQMKLLLVVKKLTPKVVFHEIWRLVIGRISAN